VLLDSNQSEETSLHVCVSNLRLQAGLYYLIKFFLLTIWYTPKLAMSFFDYGLGLVAAANPPPTRRQQPLPVSHHSLDAACLSAFGEMCALHIAAKSALIISQHPARDDAKALPSDRVIAVAALQKHAEIWTLIHDRLIFGTERT
jgi:hypothetical protein